MPPISMTTLHARAAARHAWLTRQEQHARHVPTVPSTLYAFLDQHLPRPPARVADLGCGDGWLVHHLTQRGYDAHGWDIYDYALPAVKARVHQGTVDESFPDALHGTFDAVTAVDVLEHVVDDVGLLLNAYALLRPGGVLLLTTKSGPEQDAQHLRHYEAAGVERLCSFAGFTWRAHASLGAFFPMGAAVKPQAASQDASQKGS